MSDNVIGWNPGGYNPLTTPCYVSGKLTKFLGLPPNTKLSKLQVNRMITDYIKANNLQNRLKIIPNPKLAELLDYDDYVTRVLNGRVAWARRDPNTGDRVQKVETDSSLTYSVLQHLLAKHFISEMHYKKEEEIRKYYELTEFIYNLEILLNKRLPGHKYLKTEIVLSVDDWNNLTMKQIFDLFS